MCLLYLATSVVLFFFLISFLAFFGTQGHRRYLLNTLAGISMMTVGYLSVPSISIHCVR